MLDTGQLPLSGDALLWFRQGLTSAAEEEYEQAIRYYDQVLESRPDFYEAWFERGLALERWGYYAEAISSFDRALNLHPKKDAIREIWHERGNALQYGLGDYSGAIACYDWVLNIYPGHELAWQNRGNALLYGLSRPEEALACYDRTLHINPESYLAWRNRGNALVELRRYSEAVGSYDQALRIQPDDEVSWQARNLACERSGLQYKMPTTNPAWYGLGFGSSTFIEGESDAKVTYASDRSATHEIPTVHLGQPLLVIEDESGRREVFLERTQYLVGRDPKNDIQLHSQFASRHHAVLMKIFREDGSCGYQIVDGNLEGKPSTNGLIINGQKLHAKELKPNDTIVFGPRVQAIFQLAPLSF